MSEKLQENVHKGGWEHDSVASLLTRLFEEAYEICESVRVGMPARSVYRECADVANFAMMIAENYERQVLESCEGAERQ